VNYSVVVRRIAEAELEQAKAWYNLNSPNLGDAFVTAFEDAAQAIAEGPFRWQRYHKDVRRYVMNRFPYIIYFDLREANGEQTVRILRVVHASRDPMPIRELLP